MAISLSGSNLKRGPITTGDRNSVNKVEDKRRSLYKEKPVDATPLMKMLQLMPKQVARNSVYSWAGQRFASRVGSVTDAYTDAALTTACGDAVQAGGSMAYLKMAEDNAKQILVGQQLLLSSSTESVVGVELLVDVVGVTLAGANSYVSTQLFSSDSNKCLYQSNLSWRIAGNAQSQLSGLPDGVYEEPVWFENCTQIFMSSLSISGTEMAEEDYLDESFYVRQKAQSFEQLNMDMERTFIFGEFSKTALGSNGKLRKRTMGLKSAIRTYEPNNIFNTTTWTKSGVTTANATWPNYGWDFLKDLMRVTSIMSKGPKKVFCGDLAMSSITDLVEELGVIQLTPDYSDNFGMRVNKVTGMNTELHFIQHPLFATDPAYKRSMLILSPERLLYRPLKGRDVKFLSAKDMGGSFSWVDGIKEGWVAEAGLGFDGLSEFAWVDGMGLTHGNT